MPNSSTLGMCVRYVGTVRGLSGRNKESTNSIVEDTSIGIQETSLRLQLVIKRDTRKTKDKPQSFIFLLTHSRIKYIEFSKTETWSIMTLYKCFEVSFTKKGRLLILQDSTIAIGECVDFQSF